MLASACDRFFTRNAMSARYALYYAPAPGSAWDRFGAAWLARDDARLREPRRYGFHATLKAPFRLRPGARPGDLVDALDAFTRTQCAFTVARLRVARLDGFFALVPARPEPRLDALAAECVRRFDGLRAPLSDDELARRRRVPLTLREEALLEQWGYPYVMEEFRFHLSLTGRVDADDALEAPALPDEPLLIEAVTVFEEPEPGASFRRVHRSAFGSRGRLVYVVGPSGSGKDSLIEWARKRAPAGVCFARRTITRPPRPDAERHRAVDEAAFDTLLASGTFALHWRANGHRYGIGREIDDWLAAGRTVVVNGSREHLPAARAAYPGLEVVHVTAPAEMLGKRLAARGREPDAAIAARLARRPPVQDAALEIENAGALEDAGRRLLRFLAPRG